MSTEQDQQDFENSMFRPLTKAIIQKDIDFCERQIEMMEKSHIEDLASGKTTFSECDYTPREEIVDGKLVTYDYSTVQVTRDYDEKHQRMVLNSIESNRQRVVALKEKQSKLKS